MAIFFCSQQERVSIHEYSRSKPKLCQAKTKKSSKVISRTLQSDGNYHSGSFKKDDWNESHQEQ